MYLLHTGLHLRRIDLPGSTESTNKAFDKTVVSISCIATLHRCFPVCRQVQRVGAVRNELCCGSILWISSGGDSFQLCLCGRQIFLQVVSCMIATVLWDWCGDDGGEEGKKGEESEVGVGELHYAPGVMANE